MQLDWLWKNLVSSGLWWLAATAVAAVITWWRGHQRATKKVNWPDRVITALVVVAALSIVMVNLGIDMNVFRMTVNPETIDRFVVDWANEFTLTIQRVDDDKAFMVYQVTLPNAERLTIQRTKLNPGLLEFRGVVVLSEEHRQIYTSLSKSRQASLFRTLAIELGRFQAENTLDARNNTITMAAWKYLPINSGLTDFQFARACDELGMEIFTMQAILQREMIDAKATMQSNADKGANQTR